MPTRAAALVPILPSSDLERSLAYYQYLGFDLLERAADYARLSWHSAELHLYPDPALDPPTNSAGCYLRVADPAALRAAWIGDGVDCLDGVGCLDGVDGVETTISSHYGPTVFAVVDPDGNTLRIGPHDDPEPSHTDPADPVSRS